MRLWSLHPKHLDSKGLVALWREALLAQAVLAGNTKGYKNHSQLDRFKAHPAPLKAIGSYLYGVWQEANERGYKFSFEKIMNVDYSGPIDVTSGQLQYEVEHLQKKLKDRAPTFFIANEKEACFCVHPLFKLKKGDIETWEKL